MRKTLDIALNELRLIFLDRSIWINLIVLPMVISFAVGVANGAFVIVDPSGPDLRVDVVNDDTGPHGVELLDRLRAINTNLVLCPADNDAEDRCGLNGQTLTDEVTQERLIEQTSLALIVIPASFSERLDAGEDASLIYRSSENAAAPGYILQAVQAAAQQIGGAQVAVNVGLSVAEDLDYLTFRDEADREAFAARLRETAATAWKNPPARVAFFTSQSEGEETRAGLGFNQAIPGIASMYVMVVILPAAAVLLRERRIGTFQRAMTMPVRRWELLGGRMVARFVVGMIEYAVIFAFGALLGVRYGNSPVAMVVLMMAFVLCVTALTLMLTTFLRSEQQAQSIALFASLTLAPLGGAWWPLSVTPAWMQTIGQLSPVYWVMTGFNALFYTGAGFDGILTPVAVLLGMTALFFAVGVARFKVE